MLKVRASNPYIFLRFLCDNRIGSDDTMQELGGGRREGGDGIDRWRKGTERLRPRVFMICSFRRYFADPVAAIYKARHVDHSVGPNANQRGIAIGW